jgi:anti-sigma regulatory factor (Ser/Thr protein kinase)
MSNAAVTIPQVRIFEGSPVEVRNVRDFVGLLAGACPVAEDVVLLASELATNAVLHTASGAGGTFSVSVHAEHTWVRVEVHDLGSDIAPAVRRTGSPGESGSGLSLVETLADRWGFHGGQGGRVVWFEVDWR